MRAVREPVPLRADDRTDVVALRAEQLVARDERLIAMRAEEDSWLAAHPEFRRCASHYEGGEVVFTALKGPEAAEQRIIGALSHRPEERRVPPTHTALSQLTHDGALALWRDLREFRVLRPDASRLGEPSDPLESGALAEDGSNLPTLLAGLPAPVLGAIRAELVALVPGFASFEVVPAAEQLRLDFELSGGERTPARLVSDGTLRILLLLTALRLEPRPSLIAIEEPESGIYPGRLRALLELLRDEAERCHDDGEVLERLTGEVRAVGAQSIVTNLLPTQILVSTHSPVVLAALRKHLRSLRFVDVVRRDGRRATRLGTVGGAASTNRASISPREIDMLLQSARSEEP